jgi:hypothetical protein
MSRRTFPRATAAGLIAAALGTTSPASAQFTNPWRGETGTIRSAPTPRPVAAQPTRELIIGVGFSSNAGLTGSVEVRDLTRVQVAPAPREVTAVRPLCVDLDMAVEHCPLPTQFTAQSAPCSVPTTVTFHVGETVATNTLKPLVLPAPAVVRTIAWTQTAGMTLPAPRYLEHYPRYFPPTPAFPLPREQATMTEPEVSTRSPLKPSHATRMAPVVQTVSYTTPAFGTAVRYMPPPAPLPIPQLLRPVPQGDVLVPVQFEIALPPKGLVPAWTPSSNAVPHGMLQLLDSVVPTPASAQGRPSQE